MTGIIEQESADLKTKSEWTILKEVIGTFIGVSPFVVMLVIWGATLQERVRVAEIKVDHLEEADRKHDQQAREQRAELISRLDRIGSQIEVLQQLVARTGGK
jgi:hypothetical protein